MRLVWGRFWADETAATAIEYGLLASLIGVILISGARRLGNGLALKFGAVANAIGTTVS